MPAALQFSAVRTVKRKSSTTDRACFGGCSQVLYLRNESELALADRGEAKNDFRTGNSSCVCRNPHPFYLADRIA